MNVRRYVHDNADLIGLVAALCIAIYVVAALYPDPMLPATASRDTTQAAVAVADSHALVESATAGSPWPAIIAGIVSVTLTGWLIWCVWREAQR